MKIFITKPLQKFMNKKTDHHVSELCRNVFEIWFKFSSEMKRLFLYDEGGVHFTNEEVPINV